jgi:hypothetical protein
MQQITLDNVWINAKATTERDYGAAVRKCFAGRA